MNSGAETKVRAFSLRERKAATTRLGLLDAMLAELRDTPFDDIKVRDLCAAVSVSEPTFFNYFAAKTHLLGFFVQLWSVDMGWRMARASSGRKAINELFVLTARSMAEHPSIMPEVIAWQTRHSEPPALVAPTGAELLARFPTLVGITELSPQSISVLVASGLQKAVDDSSLGCRVNRERLTVALTSLFFGAPSWLRTAKEVEAAYRDGIAQLWPRTSKRRIS